MSDKRQVGIYEKFRVERTDGQSARGGKHDGCDYFVLDLVHDQFSRPALKAYAKACEPFYPRLAADLRLRLAGKLPTYADDPNNPRQPFAPKPPVPVAPPVPLTVERFTLVACQVAAETDGFAYDEYHFREFLRALASRLIPQPEENT